MENSSLQNIIQEAAFILFRESGGKSGAKKTKKAKSSSRKYVCPCCGTIVRATKEVRIMCADCNELMEEEI